MLRSYRGIMPRVAASAYIDPSAQVIGDVEIGERASVWPLVTIRGDVNYIRIGEESNVQDNSVLHVQRNEFPLILGNRVSVAHSVTLHGCVVEDDCLIGIGAIVLNGVRVGKGSIIAAGALVSEGTQIPPGSLFMGMPARLRRAVTPEDTERILKHARNYVMYRETYMNEEASR